MMNNSNPSSGRVLSVMGVKKELRIMTEENSIDYSNPKEFIDDIPKLFKNVQGVIFNVFDYQPTGYKSNMNFCVAVREKLDAHQIKYYFETLPKSAASMLLVAANVAAKPQELVYIVFALDDEVAIMELEYTVDGFKERAVKSVPIDLKENPKLVRDKILGASNPKKIILTPQDNNSCKQMLKFLRTVLKSKKLVVFDDVTNMRANNAVEVAKWFKDKSYTKFRVLPTCARNYFLVGVKGSSYIPLLALDRQEQLPYIKSICLTHSEAIAYGCATAATEQSSVQILRLKEKCHQHHITVTIDAQNFLDVKCEAVIFHQVNDLPKNLDTKFDKTIPVIGIFCETSVLCMQKDGKYQFLDGWNGLYGKRLYISFEEKKPKFCENVPHPLEKKAFVVYDLMKIMSYPSDKIVKKDDWGFTITKDAENPVLIEFDSYDGTRKAASPAFLMALLLKQHKKAIKKEIGQKPAEIGICLLQEFTEDERKRIEEQLEESCKLLEIGCVFVNV